MGSGFEVITKNLCSTELSMKFFLLINVKNRILGLFLPEKC